MNFMKLCHLADIHLGFKRFYKLAKNGHNQREFDVCRSFEEAINKVIQIKPDLTIIAGDLFDVVRPSNYIITFCYRQIKKLANATKAPIVIIGGNHEIPKKLETGCALKILEEIKGVYCADIKNQVFDFPELDCSVFCAPYSLEPVTENIKPQENRAINVLVLHGQVAASKLSSYVPSHTVDLNQYSQYQWDYIALGHIHSFERISHNAAYPGSIDFVSPNFWHEAGEDKGFLEVVLPGPDIIFHKLSSVRDVVNLGKISALNKDENSLIEKIKEKLDELSGGIEGKILRLEVVDIDRKVLKGLDYKEIRKFKAQALHLLLDLKQDREINQNLFDPRVKQNTLIHELGSFVNTCSGTVAKELNEIFNDYYKKSLAGEE